MITESLAFRTARDRVRKYRDESEDLIMRHEEAIDCRDCEDFLRIGIEAFKWLARADETVRAAIFAEKVDYDISIDSAIAALYREWLKPCDYAEKWVANQIERGFQIENLEEFRACCKEVYAIVKADEGEPVNDAIIALRDDAIDAYARGETLVFSSND